MAAPTLLGDLRERPDGSFDGWCWAPDRPEERLVVDLLVNDTLAISMVAAIFRRDLQLGGHGDGRHGFVLRLPPGTPELDGEALITARERRTGLVFGRVLREATGAANPGGPALDGAALALEDAWAALAAGRSALPRHAPAQRLRGAFAALAQRLRARTPGLTVSAAPPLNLPLIQTPCLTIGLLVRDASAELARIAALAPALALVRAEVLAIDPGNDPAAALRPAQVRNLRSVRDRRATGNAAACNLALAEARGARLLWLGSSSRLPSAAALLALADAMSGAAPALWLPSGATLALPGGALAGGALAHHAIHLPAALGVMLCMDRALCGLLGPLDADLDDGAGLDCADLACKARLLGVAVHEISEPGAPLATALRPSAGVAAQALFRSRWGMLDPVRRGA